MKRAVPLIVAAAGALVASAASSAAPALHRPTAAQVRPRAFASCPALVGYARAHFAVTHGLPEPPMTPLGVSTTAAPAPKASGGPVAGAAAATDGGSGTSSTGFSTTNNQEQGVDEPDIVKTDGSTIFTVSQNKLFAVAVDGGKPRLAGSLDLGSDGYGAELLLRGNRVIVISNQAAVGIALGGGAALRPAIASSPYYLYGGKTTLTEVDVHNPSAMKVTQTMSVDGRFVDARQSGSSARIVISSAPHVIVEPLLQTKTSGWIPTRQFRDLRSGRGFSRPVAACSDIRRPVQFSGLGMLTIVTLDFDRGLGLAHSDALMADAQVVYGSQSSLYVATQKWVDPRLAVAQLPSSQTTVIDRFDVTDPDQTTFVSSGEVPGYLLNQFSLSEYNGYLRVATTSRPIWWGAGPPQTLSQSYVTVLASSGGLLVPVGQVSGLGAGEQIYSVRFVDDTGYVVTFRQVDPLYTIDLSTPTAPRVAGQLELSGYSAYLHPVGDGLLLGIGVDVGAANNEPTGTQLELFDVSDAATPKLLAHTTLGGGSSTEVQYDHHAFLFWPPTKLAVLPVQIYATPIVTPLPQPSGGKTQSGDQFIGAIGFQVDRSGIKEVGRVVHDPGNGSTPVIRRSLVIGDQLFTISDGGVLASSLGTLAQQAFVAFPTPAPSPTTTSPVPGSSVASR